MTESNAPRPASTVPRSIDELKAVAKPSPALIDEFVAQNSFPLTDPHGVTFVYRGEAKSVRLRHWVYGLQTAQPLERLADTDLWYHRLELPEGSRIEYKFDVDSASVKGWILDPLNPAAAMDPFGANSVCRGFGYRRPGWSLPNDEARPGTLDEVQIASTAFGGLRHLRLYLPARFRRTRRYPLLIAHDGNDFLRFADLRTVLDNLIHRLEIAPLIVALTHSPDRLLEYAGHDAHASFLAEDLLPWVEAKLPLLRTRRARGLMGASFGGVASLHAAWKYPDLYGSLLLQSGSFAFSDIGGHQRGKVFDPVVRFMNEFRKRPGVPAPRMYVSCGTYESLIYENRALAAFMQDKPVQMRYQEVRDGHNWENWRDRLQEALSWLFPGPLWMVYE